MTDHNKIAAEIHAANAHWWRDLHTGQRIERNQGELLMLMVSEVAEAMEGERKNLMDDKLPHRKMAEVELADVLIRIYDFAGGFGLELWDVEHWQLDPLPVNKGEALLQIVAEFVSAAQGEFVGDALSDAIALCCRYASEHGYDLDGAMAEKRAYNAIREDHKTEARLAENGKKF